MNVYKFEPGSGLPGVCATSYSAAAKLIMAILDDRGPLMSTQIMEMLGGEREKTYERIYQPLESPLGKGMVQRSKWRFLKKNVVIYRVVGDSRDWLCNQLHPHEFRQIADRYRGMNV